MKRIALFDFDGTLIKGDSIVHLMRFALRQKEAGLKAVLPGLLGGIGYKLRLTDEKHSKDQALRFLSQMNEAERSAFLQRFVREALRPGYFIQGKEKIDALRSEGIEIWLVSASTYNYMQYVKTDLKADILLCTETDANGHVIANCKGEEKVRRIRLQADKSDEPVDWEHSFSFADSRSDLPMLALTGNSYWVNPGKALTKRAQEIPILHWH